MGLRAGLDNVEKRKFLTLPGLELRFLGRPARSETTYPLIYPGSFQNISGCNVERPEREYIRDVLFWCVKRMAFGHKEHVYRQVTMTTGVCNSCMGTPCTTVAPGARRPVQGQREASPRCSYAAVAGVWHRRVTYDVWLGMEQNWAYSSRVFCLRERHHQKVTGVYCQHIVIPEMWFLRKVVWPRQAYKISLKSLERKILERLQCSGCETWSLTLREVRRLRAFANRVLRRIFGPKRDEVTGGWRKLHNEELHNLYSSPSIVRIIKSRRMRWAGHVVLIGEKRNACRI
jgi:hypothetical protein